MRAIGARERFIETKALRKAGKKEGRKGLA
jgi:hypothetical protein